MDLAYIQTGISEVFFWVLNFENLYFFWHWSKLLYFLGSQALWRRVVKTRGNVLSFDCRKFQNLKVY